MIHEVWFAIKRRPLWFRNLSLLPNLEGVSSFSLFGFGSTNQVIWFILDAGHPLPLLVLPDYELACVTMLHFS